MNLTKEQSQAINLEKGNILVSAGAGSGKTEVLSERIIRKIKDGISLDNLLVLTFTNLAALMMKERIRKKLIKNDLKDALLEIDSAHIMTFDAFSLEVVNSNYFLLGLQGKISILDDSVFKLKQIDFLEEIFEEEYQRKEEDFLLLINLNVVKGDNSLKKNLLELYKVINNEKDAIINLDEKNLRKKFLKGLDDYEKMIEEKKDELTAIVNNFPDEKFREKLLNSDDLLNNNFSYRGDYKEANEEFKNKKAEIKALLKTNLTKEEYIKFYDEVHDINRVLVRIIKKLHDKMCSFYKNSLTFPFDEVAYMLVDLLENHPSVRYSLKEQFNEILIDEYQDTSDIQERAMNLISRDNLYMVGDIKQSIYRFRNANPKNFQEKFEKYSKEIGGSLVRMDDNFRSRSEVIDVVNEIFKKIMTPKMGGADYFNDHIIKASNPMYEKDEIYKTECFTYKKGKNPYKQEATIIAEDILKKVGKLKLVSGKTATYNDFAILLPVTGDFIKYKEVLNKYQIPVKEERDRDVVNDDMFLVIKNILTLINEDIKSKKFKYGYVSVSRSFLFEKNDDLIYKEITETYDEELLSKILSLKNFLKYYPLKDLLDEVFLIFEFPKALNRLGDIEENLEIFFMMKNTLKSFNDSNLLLEDFLRYIEYIKEYALKYKIKMDASSKEGVLLLNSHKSKGLEFPICYMGSLSKTRSAKELREKINYHSNYGFVFPLKQNNLLIENPVKTMLKEVIENEEISERLRIFYVTLTRACEKMIFIREERDFDNKFNRYDSFLKYLNIKEEKRENFKNYLEVQKLNTKPLEPKIEENNIKTTYIKDHLSFKNQELQEEGIELHKLFEYSDFKTSDNQYIKCFLNHFSKDFLKSLKEYEFIDAEGHGIIDLILIYEEEILVIDYKANNIYLDKYQKQVTRYMNHLKNITDKTIKGFLYSIKEDKVLEIK